MSLVNKGFDGTVTEADFAMMMFIGAAEGVESAAAWKVTQGTGRQVSCAADDGWAFAAGVVSKDDSGPLTKSLSTPIDGQWFLVVRRINWATNTVTLEAVAGAPTSTTTPTAPPSAYPSINRDPGVLFDQPLAWAWVRSSDTSMVLFDLRLRPGIPADLDALAELGGPEGATTTVVEGGAEFVRRGGKWVQVTPAVFASASDRDTAYAKASAAYRVAYARARTLDTGFVYEYRAIGSGGWYVADVTRITPTALAGTGAVADPSGKITWTDGKSASPLTIDGCFPDGFSMFRITMRGAATTAVNLSMVLRTSAPADDTTSNYQVTEGLDRNGAATSSTSAAAAAWAIPGGLTTMLAVDGILYNPNEAQPTSWLVVAGATVLPQVQGNNSLVAHRLMSHNGSTVMRGFKLTPSADFTGVLEIIIEGIPD